MKMMKKLTAICLAAALLAGCAALAAAEDESPRIILFTCYTNLLPDGLELQAGCVDEDGGLWTLEVPDADLTGCGSVGEYLNIMMRTGRMQSAGQVGMDMFELKSLVYSVEDRGSELEAVAEGGGGECSYSVEYSTDGSAREVLLGASGDSRFENTDPNAQALYLFLRNTFPGVKNAAYRDAGPRGFQPVSLVEFCKWQDIDFSKVTVTGYLEDCEEGPIPAKMTEEEQAEIIRLVTTRQVVGKANATMLTGGPTTYVFRGTEDNWLGSLTLYEGLLVTGDGMYYLK